MRFILALLFLLPISAHAEVFDVAVQQGNDILSSATPILEGLGVLAILGVGAMAFSGRMPWGWAFGIIGGLTLAWLAIPLSEWVVELAGGQSAQNFGDLATGVNAASTELASDAKDLLYIVAGIFIVGAGIMASYRQIPWSWFFTLCGGLMLIGASTELAAYFAATSPDDSYAQGAYNTAASTFLGTERIVYGIGGIAILGVGATAMIMGRFRWDLFFGICGGLAFLACITIMMQFIAGVNPY